MKTVVEVKDLVKRYKELVALDHFQLSIKEGEISVFLVRTVPEKRRRFTAFWVCFLMTKERFRCLGKR